MPGLPGRAQAHGQLRYLVLSYGSFLPRWYYCAPAAPEKPLAGPYDLAVNRCVCRYNRSDRGGYLRAKSPAQAKIFCGRNFQGQQCSSVK